MNVKVDKQNLIPFPQPELKGKQKDGADNNYLAVRESFGEILEREFSLFSEKPNSPSEWNPLQFEKNTYESTAEVVSKIDSEKPYSSDSLNQTKEQNTKPDSKEETTEEDDLDQDALEYSIGILSNQSFFDKNLVPANESNETNQKEKTISLSLQKASEKNISYGLKESKSFLDETKKLAESFFNNGQLNLKDSLSNSKQTLQELLPTNLLQFTNAQKKVTTEIQGKDQKQNLSNLSIKLENTPNGMTLVSSGFQKEKGIRGLENENLGESSVRKLETKSKHSKSQKLESLHSDSNVDKDQNNVTLTSDKMIRSLGWKEKEFQKQNENKSQFQNEKLKLESNFANQVQTISSSKMGEENGRSSEDKGTKQGFNLHSVENKIHSKADGVKNLEKTEKPKESNLKQNLDELIKQAKFDIVQNGKSTAEIIMNPKEYGRLTLKVTVDGEKVEGRILVESEELQKSLQNEIQSIKDNLKESGLDLQALMIDLWDDGNHFAERQNQNELYQTLIESAKNRGKSEVLEKEEGLDLDRMTPTQESKVLEFFA
ncbi:flagellar hook-length control protein FliK [Leptospira sp. WS39.C2]